MAIVTRKSAFAVKVETTEGTPVSPTANTDYIPIQQDASMSPAVDTLTNDELRASIGSSKSILGAENPTASVTTYLKASGVVGSAPDTGELLKATFGDERIGATEYDTVAASTTSVVKVDAGEGTNFSRGRAVLVKHPASPYEIRSIESVSGDDLTLGFALNNAPGTGVNLGQDVSYAPVSDGHQTLSLWHYLGNGGATQMESGCRVTDFGIEFTAGELITSTYGIEGLEYFFNPIEITATDIYVDFTNDDGTFAATVTADFYKDPHELAAALTTAMNNTATTETHAVTYSDSTGKFTFANTTGATLSLLWNTGTNTANTVGDKIGFSVAADDTGATSYEGDNALSFASPQSPSFDDSDPLAAKDNRVMIGDTANGTFCFPASSVSFSLTNTRRSIDSICAASARSGSIIQSREVTVSVTALLEQYDADQYRRFRENSDTKFEYNFGTKSGGNWIAGKCGSLFLPTATISSFNITDDDGLITLEMELTAFVNSDGEGEAFLSFV